MVFVTETWLHTDVSSGLLDPKSKYVILRKDRNGKGGGVCAFVKRNINVMTIDISTAFSILEVLCFDVIFSSRDNLRFFVVYRPPYCGVACDACVALRRKPAFTRSTTFADGDDGLRPVSSLTQATQRTQRKVLAVSYTHLTLPTILRV